MSIGSNIYFKDLIGGQYSLSTAEPMVTSYDVMEISDNDTYDDETSDDDVEMYEPGPCSIAYCDGCCRFCTKNYHWMIYTQNYNPNYQTITIKIQNAGKKFKNVFKKVEQAHWSIWFESFEIARRHFEIYGRGNRPRKT